MSRWMILGYFLTLVVTPVLAFAAPTAPTPRPSQPPVVEPSESPSAPKHDDLQWAHPVDSDLRQTTPARLGSKTQAHIPGPWTLSLGLRSGTDLDREDMQSSTTASLLYQTKTRIEYGGEFDTRGILRIAGSAFFPFWEDSTRQPFVTLGVQQSLSSEAFFGSLMDLRRLKVRTSVGLAELFAAHRGWRSEISAAAGANGAGFAWSLGRSF